MINPVLERSFFLSMYRQIPSPALEIDLDHVASLNSVDVFAMDSPIENTVVTTPQPKTKFDMEIRITNRIYNNTLNDQDSEEYISLRQEVEQLFFDVYSPTPLLYVGTDQITFRNGSVIASAELLFETTMINPVLERRLFLSRYRDLTSPQLRIDPDYVENQLPQQPVEDVNTTTPTTPLTTTPSMTTPLTSTPNITTQTTIPTSHSTSTIPPTHTTTLTFSTVVDNTTYTLHSTSGDNTTYMLHSTSINSTSTPLNNTMHPSTNETQSPENMDITGGAITAAPNDTNTTSSSTPNDTMSTSIHNTINSISTVSSSISTVSSILTDSPTKAATVVPDWGIALLVLAAISLLLLIILLIILLVMCCCKKNRRTFVKESEAITPTMYFNPDIPMYSTHSIIDSANGKQADVREKPPANRTGMYVVNK
nr:mucin-3A isoform X2 [Misgurnus anguillicaudatus]